MKKTLVILFGLAVAVAAQAQTNIQRGAASPNIAALSAAIDVQIVATNGFRIYTVTVPDQAAAFLAGVRRTNETEVAYVKRAFTYGVMGMMNERRFREAQAITISNRIVQLKLSAATNAAALSNQLQIIKAQIQ